MGKINNILAGIKARMPTLERSKKASVGGLAVILLLLLLTGWGLYEKFGTGEQSGKVVTVENKKIDAGCIKPKITLFTPVEPPKKKSGSNRIRPPRHAPEKAIVAQAPKEGTECVVGEHHGVAKVIDGKIHCVWEERAKEQPAPMPSPVKMATAPAVPAVIAPPPSVEPKSLLDGVDPDFGKTKVEFTPLPEKEAPPRRRRVVVVVVDQPQNFGGWYSTQVPSPYYYTSTPAYVPTQQVVVAAPPPVVGRPPSGFTGPAGPAAVGRAPSGVTR